MNEAAWWGLLFMVWIVAAVPLAIPASEDLKLVVRFAWISGLVFLIWAHFAEWPPSGAAIALVLLGLLAGTIYLIRTKFKSK